ncbi:hypothetical protein J4477_00865 [Candidatus Pacearchaeota archaeon]|nr:hypothetical protein [Candidatus Pacearchaeota archaeon]
MTLKDILEENKNLTVEGLQRLQAEYDKMFVADEFQGFDKIRHTYAHMGKLFGRLAEYVQMIEDGHADYSPEEIKTKVIPDLLVYSVWLAQEFGVNIEEAYLNRFVGNIKRLHADKITPEDLNELEELVNKRLDISD